MELIFQCQPAWPPLAWLARCERATSVVTVYHGARVEVTDSWFCEAVWAGPFEEGNFDRTDIVAGSGGRMRLDGLRFVSSGSTVDRLQKMERADAVWVSNSLACLLAAVEASLDPSYPSYYDDAISIVQGLTRYKRTLTTSVGDVDLVYFDNLLWDGMLLTREPKAISNRDFSCFETYHAFLDGCMGSIAKNLQAAARRFGLRMLGTLSSGYDSTAATVLARGHGLSEVLTFDVARQGSDSGEGSAARLDLRVHRISRDAWRDTEFPEIPFIASYSSAEDVVLRGAEQHLGSCVLMTGYHGDKVWDKLTKSLGPDIVRGDPSGLALTEYRLWVGFLHCAVPFWGVRQIRDINAISASQAMKAWDIPGGYSRPICRRIAEDAGILRGTFGIEKRAVTTLIHNRDDFLTAAAAGDYVDWLRAHRRSWLKRGRIPPLVHLGLDRWIHRAALKTIEEGAHLPGLWRLTGRLQYRPTYLRRYVFPWAMDRAKQRYRTNRPMGSGTRPLSTA